MESFATPYPLIFFDGEQEQDKGFVGIHSALTFRRFQSLLSQKTGIPPNQLSTVFVCRKTLKGLEKRQRLPINGNTNFNILLNQHNPNKERDCYFLVSMKRPKKERKGSRKRGADSEVPDEWEFNSTNGVEGRDHLSNHPIEETFLQGSVSSNYAAEASVSSFISGSGMSSKHFMDSGVENNRAPDNKVGRVILKRGNTSFFQRQGRSYGESQASQQAGGSIVDEYAQLHSPRFAALRPEDQRDLNWKWEESFARAKARDQWDLHVSYALPHNATNQTEVDFRSYSPERFNVLYPEDQVGHSSLRGTGRLVDSYNHNFHRNGALGEPLAHSPLRNREFLHFTYSKPSFLAPRTPPLFRDTDLQRIRDPLFERHSQLHYLSKGDWQKMPAASGAFVEIQDATSIESGANEEATQSLFCQLCFECKRRNVSPIPFHWCVEDAVTNGFQGPSPAGPIGRRAKALHVEATA
eukprot:c19813_g1_i1 orf=433-1833(-)